MENINTVVLVGTVTKDLELRYTNNSKTATTKFSIAVNRSGKDNGADFPTIVAFGKTAETLCKYAKKGTMLTILGGIRTGSWTDKNGDKHYTTEVMVSKYNILFASKNGNTEETTEDEGYSLDEVVGEEELPF